MASELANVDLNAIESIRAYANLLETNGFDGAAVAARELALDHETELARLRAEVKDLREVAGKAYRVLLKPRPFTDAEYRAAKNACRLAQEPPHA